MPSTKSSRLSPAAKKRGGGANKRSTFGDNDLALWGGETRSGKRGPDRAGAAKRGKAINKAVARGAIRKD